MPIAAEHEEGLMCASEKLGLLAHTIVDYAMDAASSVMRAYDDDELWEE